MSERTDMKRSYKENPPPAGIYRITNRVNGKVFIGKGMNVQGKLNGQIAQLKWGSHPNRALQEDWNQLGGDQFDSEVIDHLQMLSDQPGSLASELAALEQLWLDKLKPYGERGYNNTPRSK